MVSLDMSNPLKFTESLCSEAFEHVHTASRNRGIPALNLMLCGYHCRR